ncbi:MAG: hypothetical protein HQ478_02870 [Chloroflexi bacterium]|nr:hypothetical protein [Chloroflexota bacterium]
MHASNIARIEYLANGEMSASKSGVQLPQTPLRIVAAVIAARAISADAKTVGVPWFDARRHFTRLPTVFLDDDRSP